MDRFVPLNSASVGDTHINADPGTGQEGALPDADGYQAIIEELAAAVEKDGTVLDSGDSTQLSQVLAFLKVAQTFTKAQRATITALASDAGSIAATLADSNDFSHTLAENTVLANPADIATAIGQKGNIHFTQPAAGTGPFTLGFGTYWKIVGALTEENDALDTLAYEVVSATEIRAAFVNKFGA